MAARNPIDHGLKVEVEVEACARAAEAPKLRVLHHAPDQVTNYDTECSIEYIEYNVDECGARGPGESVRH